MQQKTGNTLHVWSAAGEKTGQQTVRVYSPCLAIHTALRQTPLGVISRHCTAHPLTHTHAVDPSADDGHSLNEGATPGQHDACDPVIVQHSSAH
jgi:hypothetical protein